ncbi:hypothetical protein [Rariglobus hedericola]|uniref:Uncharacterized protein n=1 Tax=Rariglobus hedericola TaxID=2597822 RepID=A0A556QS67_9BACT|nr:hypothetical protein [Rariglobus hedericola]TSJ79480.1 hypothetical protein FPL22_09390 [Rariglobus hedericola]
MRFIWPLSLLILLAGCQSAPTAKTVTAPAAPAPAVAVVPEVIPVEVLPERTEAALEARDLLLKGGQQHQVLMQSAFRGMPGFTVSSWSGLVLSPKDIKQGVVVGSGYKIDRVEIHPLSDGRLRVWAEVVNLSGERSQPEGACEFRPSPGDAPMLKFKLLPAVEAQGKILVFFESAHPQMEGYSILVRRKR